MGGLNFCRVNLNSEFNNVVINEKMKIIDLKNYGLGFSSPDKTAYVLGGARSLPKIVLKKDGQWGDFLPQYEPQFNEIYDSTGCTVWGTQNALEILMKYITGEEYNFSERYNYILAGIRPPGADPHFVSEIFRRYYVIADYLLPFMATYEEFLRPDPMTTDLLAKGQEFPYEIGHEWVFNSPQTKEARIAKMKECLTYSPLGISVTAWIYDDESETFIDNGMANTHWCVCFGWNDKGWLIFDSYNQSVKTVSYDHNIQMCKRYYLKKKKVESIKDTLIKDKNLSIWLNVLYKIMAYLKDIFKRQ